MYERERLKFNPEPKRLRIFSFARGETLTNLGRQLIFLPVCVYVVHPIAHPDLSDESTLLFSLPVLYDHVGEAFHNVDIYFTVDVSLHDEDNSMVQDSRGWG